MLFSLGSLAAYQSQLIEETVHKCIHILYFFESNPDAAIKYHDSEI